MDAMKNQNAIHSETQSSNPPEGRRPRKQVDLLNGSIFSVLARLALPIMAAALLQMAYNFVDMVWIGRLGYQPVAAVGAAGLFIWFGDGLLMLSRVGTQVYAAQALGRNDLSEARRWATAGLQLTCAISLTYTLFTLIFAPQLIGFFGFTEPETLQQGIAYLRYVSLGYFFVDLTRVLTALVTAVGDSRASLKATSMGLILNILLDPLFIFGLKWGVKGAAWATVLSQIVVLICFIPTIRRQPLLRHLPYRQVEGRHWLAIAKLGVPPAVQTMVFSGIAIVLGRMVATFGDAAMSVQKVGSQVESISWMTAEGFGVALTAFMAQNFGAGQWLRTKQGYYKALLIMGGIGLVTTSVLWFFPEPIFRFFIPDSFVLSGGVSYLKILALSQFFMCLEIMTAAAFSGVGKTLPPAVVIASLTVLRLPLAYFLMKTPLGVDGIWWAITISTIAKGTLLVSLFFIYLHRTGNREANSL